MQFATQLTRPAQRIFCCAVLLSLLINGAMTDLSVRYSVIVRHMLLGGYFHNRHRDPQRVPVQATEGK